jgi:archaellum biogenesis protein FlaJ (TadC family)
MGNVEKWLAIISVALFAMFAGEMISVYYFMLTVPEDAVVAQGFSPDPKLIQFVSIGVAPAGILAAVAYIMSRNYGSKQIGGLIIVGGIILLAGNLVVYSMVDSIRDSYVTDAVQCLPILFIILSAPVMAVGARLILKRKKRPTKEYF